MNTLSNPYPAESPTLLSLARLMQRTASAMHRTEPATRGKVAGLSLADISDASRRATAKGGLKRIGKR
ncbi:MAG TPA: hypothetical protein VHK70_07330 [Burkholderiaceae bacterium]|nr:hypothetical protein [Burkholderiaceae bacterium]